MPKQKIIGLTLGLIVFAASATIAYSQPQTSGSGRRPGSTQTASSTATVVNPTTPYTLAQVATHKDTKSCWTTVNGSVYDLTSWIAQHPGGESAIIKLCGTDGSSTFNNQHAGQGGPESALASFKIGVLKK